MKKFFFKSLVWGLCFVFLLCVAGCGPQKTTSEYWVEEYVPGNQSSGNQSSVNSNEVVNNSQSNSGSTNDEGNTDNTSDLKGATVTLAGWGSSTLEPKPTDPLYAKKQALIKDIEKKYNCKLAFKNVPEWSNYVQGFKTAMASGTKYADAIAVAAEWIYPTILMKDYLAPIDNAINLNDPALDKTAMELATYKGKHYIIFKKNRPVVPVGTYYNKTVFEKCGVKTPDEYVKQGNWNWDTFLTLAQDTSKTIGGVKYYGFALANGSINNIMTSNGGKDVIISSNGKRTYNPDTKFMNGLQFAWDLYNIHTGITPPNCGDATNVWKSGNVAMIFADGEEYAANSFNESLGANNLGFTYLPLGKDVKSYNEVYTREPGTGWVIPATAKNPDVIAQIVYEFIYPYKWATANDTIDYFGDKVSNTTAEEMRQLVERQSVKTIPTLYTYITETISWGNYGIKDKKSPQQYIDSVKAQAQAELDTIWNGYTQ